MRAYITINKSRYEGCVLLHEFSSLNLSNEVNSKVQIMRELSFLFLKKIICCIISKNRKDLGHILCWDLPPSSDEGYNYKERARETSLFYAGPCWVSVLVKGIEIKL